ncbi:MULTISPECIES: ABC transporter permease [Devosia]|uniref:Ribose transport system permease protein RbsC n=1 Tax=Devosia equisanguinis TaxID=2490941 RepID=A0A3S4DT81_9HYPH|nr:MULTISPECIES: ABC transporter permease [Devosia]ODT50876.1 MAG: ABC transporter permease [Pelagibacterium sp. SCN 63-126]ODU80527.1 MAG: ABC transporter permease [Pelagibacterium sp. SCN 63-17]OJX44463.1 MAG: ABC transporter permease [Devosia sp. 63-57]VDS06756.1 Ribose transport system permease protein RbsC [Devosia equisanguinis]
MSFRLEPRADASIALRLAVSLGAGLAALILVAIPVLSAGGNPFTAYALMVQGAFGTMFAFSETLNRATPLILTGLAAAIAFRARLWNIGAEGQLYMGALAAVLVGSGFLQLPAPLMIPAIMLAGFLAGGLMMVVPTVLKQRFGADEVVITLLLNFVVILFVQMLIEGPLKDPLAMGWPQSVPLVAEAKFDKLVPRLRMHWGLVIGLASALLLWFMVRKTVLGFEIKAVGENKAAARFAGIPVDKTMLKVALISGGLAGLAGVSEVAGVKGYLSADLSPGFGYSGIVVAMLAGLSPIGAVLAAFFIAAVFVGADSMSRATGISSYIADLVVALSLLCVLVGSFFLRFRLRWQTRTQEA